MQPESKHLPFHAGEQQIQALYGLSERMQQVGKVVLRPEMPEEHQELFAKLPIVFIGAQDADQRIWASLRVKQSAQEDLVRTPDAQTLLIQGHPLTHDPLAELQTGQSLGFLGLEFETRRRNRVSAVVTHSDLESLKLSVKQSFGNCPKYIQTRTHHYVQTPETPSHTISFEQFERLGSQQIKLIQNSDSFFIASLYQADALNLDRSNQGADVSYRGGKPGFVKLLDDQTLCFPDFSGNRFFNTLGNLLLNPEAGLLFLDFSTGDILWLNGQAEIIWSGPELEQFAGAERFVKFKLQRGRFVSAALPIRWDFGEFSPALESTGHW